MAQINKSSDYFNTVLYSGNGGTQSITGVNFQPDLTWIKNRSADQNHSLTDIVRGVTKTLRTDVTTAETTDAQGQTSFDSDGFTVGSEAKINGSGNNIVAWNWLADNTSGSSNTDGSITSTVSANTTSGFSIVSYTGTGAIATVGHGLGAVPKMLIIKNRVDGSGHWRVYHASIGPTVYCDLDNTGAAIASSNVFNNTTPTSSLFSLGSDSRANGSGNAMIAYCFAEKKGFSKFGSYTGNGSTDGTFVYTGFKPAFLLVKNTSTSGTNWQITDTKRIGYNLQNHRIYPDDSAAESTTQTMDILSNGFKMRTTSNLVNATSANYIYMAFAENPLVGTNNIPTTAR